MRKWVSIISVVIIFLVVLIIAALWQINRVLKSSHIENLHYQIQTLHFQRIQLSELSFDYALATNPHTIQIHDLDIDVDWQNFLPQLAIINAQRVSLVGATKRNESQIQTPKKSSAIFSLPKEWRAPGFFPKQIHIQQLILKQPCATEVCTLTGRVDILSPAREKITLNLIASPGDQIDAQHQLRVNAVYSVEKKLPKLDASVSVDENINIQLTTHLLQKPELYWLGKLTGSGTYLDDWWSPYLTAWNINVVPKANELPTSDQAKLSLQSDWQLALTPLLNLPATADATQRKQAISGRWFLDAQIPLPLKILNVGRFAGQTKIDVEIAAGQLNRYAVTADINAEDLASPETWQTFGLQVDKVHLNLQSKVEDSVSLASLPVEFSGSTQGALQSKFAGHLLVDVFSKKIIADRFSLTAKVNKFSPFADYEFSNINLDLHAIGYWQPESFSFGLREQSQLSTDAVIKSLTLNAKSARVMANQLSIAGKIAQGEIVWQELNVDSNASLSVDKLSHAQLKPNSWRWQGKTKGALKDFDVKGELSVGSALSVNHHATVKASELKLEWKLADLFLLAANPFANVLQAWPPLLSLARGKLNASGNILFNIDSKALKSSKTEIQFQDVAGIYDTYIVEGFNTQASVITQDKTIKITGNDVKVNQINKGFILGPFSAAGVYQADWENFFKGKLALKYLNGVVLGGSISTTKQDFDFSRSTQNFSIALKQVNLGILLQQHPASELSGSGQLSGNVPVEINSKGIRITKGLVAAESPGGSLKYQSARAAEIAKTQPSMKLLTEALSDFHYSVLASEVNYDEKGKLILSIHLEGKNPKLEKGRPINLNVNFEEDIPAMLASIQLSSKVNDVVKKRLQEYLQKQPASKVTP